MTREELRDYVEEQRNLDIIPYHVYSTLIDGIDTLEQEPCEDKIIEWKKDFKEYVNSLSMLNDDYKGIMEYIDELPVTPKPKTGYWVYEGEGSGYKKWHCFNCKMLVRNPKKPWYSFCPNCGAKMVESQESEKK